MKNTKAVFFIILGSFIIATGFAFAENVALGQAERWLDKGSLEQVPVVVGGASSSAPAVVVSPAAAPTPAAVVPAPAAAPAAKPEEKPTFGENVKKFLGKHMATMAMVGIGAYVGFALMGPAGILMGALFMYAFTYLGNL